MAMKSVNPATQETLADFELYSAAQLDDILQRVSERSREWQATSLAQRVDLMRRAGEVLRAQKAELAMTITEEMGKLLHEAEAEVEKSAVTCDYYAGHAEAFLADELIESDAGKSFVAYQPLGTILAVMPWNFPIWQVMRFAIPSLLAGNTAVLKHASNVPRCALAMETVFRQAGFPEDCFRTLLISAQQVATVIADPRVHAVTLTGSEAAGRKVAALAGQNLKKTVLELGGSDAFVVLSDADIGQAVETAVVSRFLNCGQSCIAAKRFIVVNDIADEFVQAFAAAVAGLKTGDPTASDSRLAPMARADLRDELQHQVDDSVAAGAQIVAGGQIPEGVGFYYPATLLDQVSPDMPAYQEEMFGPVASVIRVADEQAALQVANDNRYGLGGSVWTRDRARGESFARAMQSGAVFVNGLVKSDARLPFGGIKCSGYGRELSLLGIREFVNAKTIWIK